MLDAHVVVFELGRFLLRTVQNLTQTGAQIELARSRTLHGRKGRDFLFYFSFQLSGVHVETGQNLFRQATLLLDESEEEVLELYLLLAAAGRQCLGLTYCFLGLFCEFIEIHRSWSSLNRG